MSAITAKASRKMKKYAVLTREPRCFLGSFDFSWEQRKVQDVADRFDNLRIPVAANLRVHGTTPYYGANGIQDYVEGFTHDGEFVLVAEDGANDLKNYPVKCVNGRIWVNNHAHILQGKAGIADNSFLAFAISQSGIESLLVGGGRAKLNAETLMSIEFRLPCLQEQYRIGEYLTQLDHLITLHQRKCANLCSPSQVVFSLLFVTSTFSWEQRKFGSLLKETREKTKIENEDTLLSCAINGMYLNSELFSHFRGSSNIGYLKVKKNDLILSSQNLHLGNCNVNLRFEHGIISPAYKVYELVACDPLFIQAWVKQDSTKDFFLNASTEGASVCRKNIVWNELYKQTLPIPKIKEQEQIGKYFNELDNLITLHQRECISFTGRADRLILTANKKRTTSSWEQRKLGDVVQITMGQSPDGSTYSDEPSDYILVQGNADLQNGWVCPRIWTTQITKKADAGDLIMSVRAPAGAMGKTAYNAVIGRGVAAIKGNEFIYQLLVKMDADGFWKTLSCGSTFESLNSDNIKNAEVKIPTTAEQIKIGGYFQQLDNLITLHQRKPFLMKWRTSDANRNQTNRLVL